MAHEVTLITGDGTGPELSEAARRCIDATGVKINWTFKKRASTSWRAPGLPFRTALSRAYVAHGVP